MLARVAGPTRAVFAATETYEQIERHRGAFGRKERTDQGGLV